MWVQRLARMMDFVVSRAEQHPQPKPKIITPYSSIQEKQDKSNKKNHPRDTEHTQMI